MSIFSKQGNKQDATSTGTKRDVTIINEPKKRPDHVRAETADCTWKLPLTIEEQSSLSHSYEEGVEDEEQMLGFFVESVYQASAEQLTVEMKPYRPGEVWIRASSGHHFREMKTVPYADVGHVLCEWILKSQRRKELVADLVAMLPDERD
jgi:hypothetical protein